MEKIRARQYLYKLILIASINYSPIHFLKFYQVIALTIACKVFNICLIQFLMEKKINIIIIPLSIGLDKYMVF